MKRSGFVAALALATLAFAGEQARLLVLHKAASTLGFYTLEGKLLAQVPVGRHPHEMSLSADGRLVYITDNGTMRIEDVAEGGNTVSVVDIEARKKIGEISLGRFHRPHGIDLDPRTGHLLVSTENPDRLLLIDPAARRILRTYDTQGKTAHIAIWGPGGRYAYVSNAGSGTVAAIELAGGGVKLIRAGDRPEGSARAPDGRFIYVANRESHRITVIDPARNEAVGEIATGRGPVRVAVTPDGRMLVYALIHDQAVEFANAVSRKVLGSVKLEGPPVSLSLSRDGERAYAAVQDRDRVYCVSVRERRILRSFGTPTGAGPDPVRELPEKR
ncbi:MAG: beta-propeller fold lactonase family protein [Bryobacteraceae bacterium]